MCLNPCLQALLLALVNLINPKLEGYPDTVSPLVLPSGQRCLALPHVHTILLKWHAVPCLQHWALIKRHKRAAISAFACTNLVRQLGAISTALGQLLPGDEALRLNCMATGLTGCQAWHKRCQH